MYLYKVQDKHVIIYRTATKIPFMNYFFWELRGLSLNFHIHVSVSDLYIPRTGPQAYLAAAN
jgi:hypothetical protein